VRTIARKRILIRRTIEFVQDALFSIIAAVVLFRLGNMQLNGLPGFGGIAVGLLFAFTSLQFNRARAYRVGSVQRRYLFAAELSLRATLAFTMGSIVTAIIYHFLAIAGYVSTPPNNWPTQIVPGVCAFIPLGFFAYTVYTLSGVTRILIHGMLLPLSLRRLASVS
jgi:hypothetical protein